MRGMIGYFRKRKEKKIQAEERLDKRLRTFFSGFPEITAGTIDASAITVCGRCHKFVSPGEKCELCGCELKSTI